MAKARQGLVTLKVDTVGVNETVDAILSMTSKNFRRRAMRVATLEAADSLKAYYSRRGASLWENKSLPTHGPGRRKTQWWRQVANGWNTGRITYRTAQIDNATIGLAHKVTGGTIRAKRVKFLTIPIIPEAHGLTARTYSRTFAPLFATEGVLAQAKSDGGIKPVFALKRQVRQKPWPGALPREQEYMADFEQTLLDQIEKQFSNP